LSNTRLRVHDAVIIEDNFALKKEYKHHVGKKMFILEIANDKAILVDNIYHPTDQMSWPIDSLKLASEESNLEDKNNPQGIQSGDRVRLLPYTIEERWNISSYGKLMLPLVGNIKIVDRIIMYATEPYITFGMDGDKWFLRRVEKVQENDSKFQPGDKIVNLDAEGKSNPSALKVGDLIRVRDRKSEWQNKFPYYDDLMLSYVETIQSVEEIRYRYSHPYYKLYGIPFLWDEEWLEKLVANCENNNIKGKTNMPTKMTMIENAERTINDAIQAGSEGIKQGTANSAATTLVKVARPENEEELRHFLCWIQEQCADDYAKIRAGDLSEYVDFE